MQDPSRQEFAASMLRCPQCGSTLRFSQAEHRAYCNHERGNCSIERGFPLINGQPALVVFERSVLEEAAIVAAAGRSPIARSKPGRLLRTAVRKLLAALTGANPVAESNGRRLLEEMQKLSSRPILLNVGGATVGSGAAALRKDAENVRVLSFDIYASAETDFIADAHDIPLPDASIDCVWIQAVLEHVIDPERVVAEIHRVLKPGGLVYAEIPFMQTVHEEAYDFTRFTDTGVRWLFRRFDRIGSGVVLGPGRALLWSIRATLGGVLRSRKLGDLVGAILFFWVRFLDAVIPTPYAIDAACGLYFFGRKVEMTVSPKEVIRGFQGVRA